MQGDTRKLAGLVGRIRLLRLVQSLVIALTLSCGAPATSGSPTSPPPAPPAAAVPDGPFTPGQSYFGRSNYIEYIAGNAPVIFTAPHGGTLTPSEIPERTRGTSSRKPSWMSLTRS